MADQIGQQEDVVAVQTRSAELAQMRYSEGVANYLEVLDAERCRFEAEQALLTTQLSALQNDVALFVALGGGFERPLRQVFKTVP